MATEPDNFERLGPAWNDYPVMVFAGQTDTHIGTGEDYDAATLASIFVMEPGDKAKGAGPAFIPSSYHDYDGRSHQAQRERGSYVALCGDVDKGDHALNRIEGLVRGFCEDRAFLIYSSAHSRPGDRRWRIILPLDEPLGFEQWHDAQLAFFAFMEFSGVAMDHALARSGQPVYLPNVPPVHVKSGVGLRSDSGTPLYFQRATSGVNAQGLRPEHGSLSAWLDTLRRQREADDIERERIRKQAEARRARQPANDGEEIIAGFNRGNSIETMLELYGYERSPRDDRDWKSKHQTGETFATRIIDDKWVSLSASDASAGLGAQCATGCYGDAYDLYVHYEHRGEHKAAFRALYAERKADATRFQPDYIPERAEEWEIDPETGDPIGEVIADYGDDELEAIPAVEAPQGHETKPAPTAGSIFAYEWAGRTEPVIDGFWLIDDWLPKVGIAAIYGHPGCGKSFFVLHMGVHVAAGRPWASKHVEKGLVLYVVAEGATGFRNRLFAMQQSGEIDPDLPFAFIPCPIDLQAEDGDTKKLIETIRAAVEEAGLPVAMVVIDTLSKTFGAGKENTDDMVPYINNCQKVASAFQCLTVVVHHRPKDSESRDLRGHSSLRGNIDTAILVEAGQIKVATSLKQKDGEDNMQVRFELERVAIGVDKRGKEVSTCLVRLTDEAAPQPVQFSNIERAKRRLKGHKKTAFKAIEDACARDGSEPPMGIPPEIIDRFKSHYAVKLAQVADKIENEVLSVSGQVSDDPDKKADSAKRTVRRAVTDLKTDGVIGTWKEWVWVNF